MLTSKRTIIPILLLLLSLPACLSLAEDITPPPGYEAAQQFQATSEASLTPTPPTPVLPQVPPDPNNGATIYFEKCAPCHGNTGMGDGPDSNLLENPVPKLGSVDLARISSPIEWFNMVTQGNLSKFMPGFSSLSDQERWDVVSYLFTLSGSPEMVLQGEELFLANCAECHGDDGSQGEVDLTEQAFMSERSMENLVAGIASGHELMPSFKELNEEEHWSLAFYLQSLTFAPFDGEYGPGVAGVEAESQQMGISGKESETLPEAEISSDRFGIVNVQVLNKSDGVLPTNLEVTLRGYDEMTEVYTRTLTLGQDAGITFIDVPLLAGRMYFATMEYANAAYGSNVLNIEPSTSDLDLEIEYYPPSTDTSILHVDRLHVFIDFVDEQTLEVYQIYIFSNSKDKVLTASEEDGVAVNFTIPPNASNLYVEENMNMAYRKTDDGFGIVNVYPAEDPYQTVYSYQIPYDGRKMDLSIPISMDAYALIVMAPDGGFKVKSSQLEDAGTRDFEGVPYNLYTGSNLNTGGYLDLALSGHPKGSTSFIALGSDSNTNLVIGLAGFGLALIMAGVFLWRRNQGEDGELLHDDWEDQFNGDTPEDIMDAIIVLDDHYRTGDLPEGAYRQRRAALKEHLKELLDQ